MDDFAMRLQNLEAGVVNIYVDRPRGGFGDIACNVLMAYKLLEARPKLRINLIAGDLAIPPLKILIPALDTDAAGQDYRGFRIFLEKNGHLPKADATISFASFKRSELFFSAELKKCSRLRLGYLEFAVPTSKPIGLEQSLENLGHRYPVFLPALNSRTLPIYLAESVPGESGGSSASLLTRTGAGGYGFYLTANKPKPPMTFSELRVRLIEELNLDEETISWLNEETEIGFSYSKLIAVEKLYSEAVDIAASNPAKKEKKILVFVKAFEGWAPKPRSPGVRFISYSSMSFETTRALLWYARLPPMITGDVSLSISIDYEKFFFYEVNSWKHNCANEFLDFLVARGCFRDRPEQRASLARSLVLCSKFPSLSPDAMAKLILDLPFQEEISRTIGIHRRSIALAENVLAHIDLLTGIDFSLLHRDEIDGALQIAATEKYHESQAKKEKDPSIQAFLDRDAPHANRLLGLSLMLASSDHETGTRTAAFCEVLKRDEPAFSYALQVYILYNIGDDSRLQHLISAVLESNDLEAQKAMTKILVAGAAGLFSPEDATYISPHTNRRILKKHGKQLAGFIEELRRAGEATS